MYETRQGGSKKEDCHQKKEEVGLVYGGRITALLSLCKSYNAFLRNPQL